MKRRLLAAPRIRFHLRSLLAVVTVFSLWLGLQVERARWQREAVEAVTRWDGYVRYDWQAQDGSGLPPVTGRLRVWLGDELLGSIVEVWLLPSAERPTDGLLPFLSRLNSLEELDLQNRNVTDEGLKHLAGLPALRELRLAGTRITDAGLEHLQTITALRMLDVRGTAATEKGVRRVRRALPRCTVLWGSR